MYKNHEYLPTYNAVSLLSQERFIEKYHFFYNIGNENTSVSGTGYFVHRKHHNNIISIKAISTRVSYLVDLRKDTV